ncbi:IS3 family transposase [Streptomyces sp. NPDC087901]|uniref:IS3 family transposase n=1 Tax=Streptomyces sp. NPDC087901 TaxID=3365818 RepID=UPI00381E816C
MTERVIQLHARSRGTYAAPRVHAVLKREAAGCGRRRVARLMRAAGLQGRHRRRRQPRSSLSPNAGTTCTDCTAASLGYLRPAGYETALAA